ncbi:hypothetical protein C882_1375 [Caenispirillum salinarum AK4]|uniref:Uncharacterized protein n=2 Tax=Caenispirillum TaxID=414051 RepID=K9GRZ7_9PROT|nr:hypothetical protein C882_1375 [Caenispirillum salinarum AK4]
MQAGADHRRGGMGAAATDGNARRVRIALALTTGLMPVEVAGGLHAQVAEHTDDRAVLRDIQAEPEDRSGITHATVQIGREHCPAARRDGVSPGNAAP